MLRFALVVSLFSSAAIAVAPLSLQKDIHTAANRYRIDPKLVEAIVEVESASSPQALSPKGARGLMQVMPATADEMGIANPHHVLSNLMGACEYLRTLLNRFRFDLPKTLAAYNAGPHKVEKYKGIPPYPETRKYVHKVLAAYRRLKRNP